MRHVGIDPATATGFVAIGENGLLIGWKELQAKGDTPASRINNNLNRIYALLQPEDNVCIEGFAMESMDNNKVSSGFNWGARLAIDRKVGWFEVAAPNQLKKFVNVEEWEGPKGKKVRLEGKEVKARVQAAVYDHWGDTPPTYNVADAYVLARIAEALWRVRNGKDIQDYQAYQIEVLTAILHPEIAKEKKKEAKRRRKDREAKAKAQETLF